MNNYNKERNSKEVKIQLNRAEVKKNILIKNIYKEYENYFRIVRKSILTSTEKGIFSLYSELSRSNSNELLNVKELTNFLNQNINFIINSKLPLLTIEQLKLGDISDPQKKLVNEKVLKELGEFKDYQESQEYQGVDFDYENESITKESFEFHCNNNLNSYEYYELLSDDEFLSVDLDDNGYLNSFSKQNTLKNIEDKRNIIDSVIEIIEETKPNKLNFQENLNDEVNDVFISSDNLNFFETVDKAFSNFLLNLSYKINLELFKINLIKKFLTEDTFIFLSNKNNIIKHPHPFLIKYDFNLNKLSEYTNKYSDIYLFNLSNVELEFSNLDLSICRNNINELKKKFILLNKKQIYWKNKELPLKN